MIVLKLIPYDNHAGCEATWVDRIQSPDIEIAEVPEVPATFDDEGNEITPVIPAVPASTKAGEVRDTQVWCQSYHPTQMQMLRDRALSFGTSLADYNDEINSIESAYVAPPPEPVKVPQIITIRQAKLVLLAADLLDDVDAAVAQADRATQIEWEYCTEVNRQWPTLLVLASALGLDSDDLDGLFIEGSKL